MSLRERWFSSLLRSKRVYAFLSAAIAATLGERFGLTEEMAGGIVSLAVSWILGESLRPAENALLSSRRFWITLVTMAAGLLANFSGFELTHEQIQTIAMTVGAWVVGDSWRVTAVCTQQTPPAFRTNR